MMATIAIIVLAVAAVVWGREFLALPLGAKLVLGIGLAAIVFALAWWESRS